MAVLSLGAKSIVNRRSSLRVDFNDLTIVAADLQKGRPDHRHPEGGWRMVGGNLSRNRKDRLVPVQLRQRGRRRLGRVGTGG